MDSSSAGKILNILKKLYPHPHHYLDFQDPYQLLIATILSAQAPDKTVNAVTPSLFKKFPTPRHLAGADLSDIEESIRSVNFYRNKSKAIQGSARLLEEKYRGRVPDRMEDLIKFPGIARKSANVILQQGFNRVEGVVVDTHVIRLSQRLGWSQNKDPGKIESDLMGLFDRKDWKWLTFYLKSHGIAVCRAPRPKCGECKLAPTCPSRDKNN